MYTLINNLTVSRRLQLVTGLIVIFSIACALLLWNTSHSFNRDLNEVNALTDVELRVWQIRTNYNAMRGDIMQLYMADPASQGGYVEHAIALMDERVKQIKEFNAGIHPEVFDEKTAALYKPFNVALDEYVTFCQTNLPAIKAVANADSLERIRVRDVIVMEADKRYQTLRDLALKVIDGNRIHKEQLNKVVNANQQKNLWFTLAISLSLLIITFFIIRMISRSILSPIQETESTLQQLSAGQLPETREFNGQDEFSRMLRSLQLFNLHMRRLMEFVRQVANNNFKVQADMFDGQGPIAESLVSMRDNLQQAYTLELQRNWASRGLAELGDITRRQDDVQNMYDTLLSYLVKYLVANQGVLYIVDDSDSSLTLTAAYAYGKKKHRVATLQAGEGLAGQAYLEKNMIVLKNVPTDYIHITSGLGDALPRMLIISPLVSKDVVFGVLELASFREFEQHQLTFIQKISEELASVIQTARVTTKTRLLLEGSQQQAEELKAQEEEMRQNMEELQATQEGMNRMLKDVQNKEHLFTNTLDSIQTPIAIFDRQYTVVQINNSMKRRYATKGLHVGVGTNLLSVAGGEQSKMKSYYDRALQGEAFQSEHEDAYAGIPSEHGEIIFGVVTSINA